MIGMGWCFEHNIDENWFLTPKNEKIFIHIEGISRDIGLTCFVIRFRSRIILSSIADFGNIYKNISQLMKRQVVFYITIQEFFSSRMV